MGSELLRDSLLPKSGNTELTDTEQFEKVFPYYLALGMTPEQFWQGDPELAKTYRKAEELRNEKRNQEMWLQGMYIYEALCDVAPIMKAFAKKGVKPRAYSSKPYVLQSEEQKEEEKREEQQMEKARTTMDAFAAKFNQNFKKKEGNVNGRGTDHRESAN